MPAKKDPKPIECTWCTRKIKKSKKGYGQGFLSNDKSIYCSRVCVRQHSECK